MSKSQFLPALPRFAQPIWEGAGNVIALDVLRALQRSPDAGEAFVNEVALAEGSIELSTEKLLVCARRLRLR